MTQNKVFTPKWQGSSQKVLVICGPTATGKTSLALQLAKKFNGDILVADSRQVYHRMDVITGKDIPSNSKLVTSNLKINYWETRDGIKIFLTDVIDPKKDFSVAQWNKLSKKIIKTLQKENKLPIIVGGTGLYIRSLIGDIETIGIPPNKPLRSTLIGKSVDELYDTLSHLDGVRAGNMNLSDRKNPRRLVRAIEIAMSTKQTKKITTQQKDDYLVVGLTAPREVLFKKIDKRVDDRLEKGAIQEIEKLLADGVSWHDQSMSGIGYRELADFFLGHLTQEAAVDSWKTAEHKYAIRQMTWFKKAKDISWFDITDAAWEEKVVKQVQNWYTTANAKEN